MIKDPLCVSHLEDTNYYCSNEVFVGSLLPGQPASKPITFPDSKNSRSAISIPLHQMSNGLSWQRLIPRSLAKDISTFTASLSKEQLV